MCICLSGECEPSLEVGDRQDTELFNQLMRLFREQTNVNVIVSVK